MIHLHLTDEQERELERRLRQHSPLSKSENWNDGCASTARHRSRRYAWT
jgi:hypothetical protein